MAETSKYNRDLLGKTKRKPFENPERKEVFREEILSNGSGLTDSQRKELLHQMSLDARQQRKKQLLVLAISLVGAAIVAFLIEWIYF